MSFCLGAKCPNFAAKTEMIDARRAADGSAEFGPTTANRVLDLCEAGVFTTTTDGALNFTEGACGLNGLVLARPEESQLVAAGSNL
jgi:hypothetical protein